MASSIINSDDGVISGTSGLKSTGGDDGNLVFQSKGTETARINTDSQIVAAAGTASLPIYSTTGDLNTGIFFPAADTIAFAEGGAEAMRIDSSGNVGIGVTPGAWSTAYKALQFGARGVLANDSSDAGVISVGANYYRANTGDFTYIANSFASRYTQIDSQHQWFTSPSGTAGNTITFTERMRIDSSGNVGIGTTTPLGTAANRTVTTVNGTSSAIVSLGVGGTRIGSYYADATKVILGTNTSAFLEFDTNGTERARITSGGEFLVGTTSSAASKIYSVAGTSQHAVRGIAQTGGYVGIYGESSTNAANGYPAYFQNTGSSTGLYIANTAAWQSTSDERLKADIKDLDTTEKLLQIRPRDYLWKSQLESNDNKRNFGFVAQEVLEVFPDLVGVSPDGMYSVEYTGFIAPLVKAVQELKAELDTVKAELATLKGN